MDGIGTARHTHPVQCYLIIPHPHDSRALFLTEAASRQLPQVALYEPDFAAVRELNAAAGHLTGIRTATLGCLRAAYDAGQQREKRYYALDYLEHYADLPAGADWLNATEIAEHASIPQEQKFILRTWFMWHGMGGRAALRVPWAQRGWFQKIEGWMNDLADRLDMTISGSVEQLHVQSRSCTLRLPTVGSALYFKACHPAFSYEPIITRVLSIRYPGRIPEVLAVNVENAWMLTREFQGALLHQHPDIAAWEKAIRVFAEIQLDLVDNTHLLVGLGLPDRHLDYLINQVDRLLADLPPELTEVEKDILRREARMLKDLCYDILDYKVPLTLVHGNLHPTSVAIQAQQQPIFFGWSESSISHPFFDLPGFLDAVPALLPGTPDARERLLRAYLDCWTAHEPLRRLYKLYRRTEIARLLYQVISHHHFIVPALEGSARWELGDVVPALTRQLIAALRSYQPD